MVRADTASSSRAVREHLRRRGLATRYEKTATACLAGLHAVGVFLWPAR
ncbi:hypothetical protein [Streptomyces macrosporus]|uniref:Transposase n=1 Tax=Streptomyces macrosporus TaxID=44032 RepID=A0ABN3JJX9_9ACTN